MTPTNKQLFKYNGAGPLYEAKFEDGPSLFDAQFLPAAPGVFPDRPGTPPRKGEEAAAAAAAVAPPTVAAKPRAVYRPPGSTGGWVFDLYDQTNLLVLVFGSTARHSGG